MRRPPRVHRRRRQCHRRQFTAASSTPASSTGAVPPAAVPPPRTQRESWMMLGSGCNNGWLGIQALASTHTSPRSYRSALIRVDRPAALALVFIRATPGIQAEPSAAGTSAAKCQTANSERRMLRGFLPGLWRLSRDFERAARSLRRRSLASTAAANNRDTKARFKIEKTSENVDQGAPRMTNRPGPNRAAQSQVIRIAKISSKMPTIARRSCSCRHHPPR